MTRTLSELPRTMTHDDAGGLSSPEFRRLARADLDGSTYAAVDTIVGHLLTRAK